MSGKKVMQTGTPSVVQEFERIGELVSQGYNKAPEGHVCQLCYEVGGVWLKLARQGKVQVAYCTQCDGVHTVCLKSDSREN